MHLNYLYDANHDIQVALTCIHGYRGNCGFIYCRRLSSEAQQSNPPAVQKERRTCIWPNAFLHMIFIITLTFCIGPSVIVFFLSFCIFKCWNFKMRVSKLFGVGCCWLLVFCICKPTKTLHYEAFHFYNMLNYHMICFNYCFSFLNEMLGYYISASL